MTRQQREAHLRITGRIRACSVMDSSARNRNGAWYTPVRPLALSPHYFDLPLFSAVLTPLAGPDADIDALCGLDPADPRSLPEFPELATWEHPDLVDGPASPELRAAFTSVWGRIPFRNPSSTARREWASFWLRSLIGDDAHLLVALEVLRQDPDPRGTYHFFSLNPGVARDVGYRAEIPGTPPPHVPLSTPHLLSWRGSVPEELPALTQITQRSVDDLVHLHALPTAIRPRTAVVIASRFSDEWGGGHHW